jgi:hypothetical protein
MTPARLFSNVMAAAFLLMAGYGVAALASNDDPENQKESDWIDARWDRTQLGNFHASILTLPRGDVAKALSVRIGEKGEASVAYDTASLALRAGWTGGFLKFNSARYGLIRSPRPAGDIRFVASASGWNGDTKRWRGLHVHGPRVVLDYEVDRVRVKESPWFEGGEGLHFFSRTLELGAAPHSVSTTLFEGQGTDLTLSDVEGVKLATVPNQDRLLAIALVGEAAAELRVAERQLEVNFPPANATRRVKIFLLAGAAEDVHGFVAAVKRSPAPEDLSLLSQPGPSRWHPLTTRGQRGLDSEAFGIDTLTLPYENPWNALLFTSGVDFLPNGDAAVCTVHGDVWLVSGIDEKLEKLTWRRFATGLFQPLGLRVRDGRVHVLGRDQITRLHDENGDGEADFYENFFNGVHTSTSGHDYVTSLETDTNGNFYYVDPRGLHRVEADGKKLETIAAGWRNPNGLGASPNGRILTVAPQQGEWTPSSAICEVRPDGWYGYGGPKVTPDRPLGYDGPLCWIPHRVDNSGGSQLWVPSGHWGPLADHFLHFSFGRCAQFLVLREVVDGVPQGALVPLPGRFLSGAMRGAFHPRDGQLYVVGCRGWQTSAVRDGCLQRVRFTGKNPRLPIAFQTHSNGLRLTFTTPLDKAAANDPGSYALTQWNYRYTAQYGSKDYSVTDPNKEGRDTLEVRAASLLPDGQSVFLDIPGLRPVMQWELQYSLNTPEGKPMRGQVDGTIHRLAPSWRP